MCNSEASDIRVHRQSTKVWYQLNSDKPYHGFRDYKGEGGSRGGGGQFLTQSAALHTLTLFSLLVYFPLIYSCLLCSPSLSSGTEANEPNVSVCLLGQVNIWNDRGWRWLECWRRCLRAKWRTIRETVIRCMHACMQGYWMFTLNSLVSSCAEEGYHMVRAQHQTPIKLHQSWKQNQTDVYTCQKVLWPPMLLLFMHSD